MQTRTYGELIDLIQSLIGAGTMTGDDYLKLSNFINRRYSEAYNTSPSWTRYIVSSEKRTVGSYEVTGITNPSSASQFYKFVGLSNGSNNVVENSPVYQGMTTTTTGIFRSSATSPSEWRILKDITFTEDSNGRITVGSQDYTGDLLYTQSNESSTDVLVDATWSAVNGTGTPVLERYNVVPYTEAGKDDVSEFIRLHRKKAFIRNSAIEYDFFVDINGANILNSVDENVEFAFATYKKPLTLFTVAVSNPPVAADFVDGGTSNGAANRALTVPLEFFSYLAHASYADFLRMESKYEDARTEEAIAQGYLATELEKIDVRSNNNSLNKKFSTHVNRQSR